MKRRWERFGAASGLGAIVAGAAAVLFERGPVSASDPVAKIVAYYTEGRYVRSGGVWSGREELRRRV